MKLSCFLALSFLLAFSLVGQTLTPAPANQDPLVKEVLTAVGGEAKVLKLFRIQEEFHFGDKPTPGEGKKRTTRASVIEPPQHWWLGKKERAEEPAKMDVWAWTYGVFLDPNTKVKPLEKESDEGVECQKIQVSGSVEPAMDFWFDAKTKLLVRLDWRGDFYRFSAWKEADGAKYASRTVIFKKASGKPWFFHDVTGVERLSTLPEGLVRPAAQSSLPAQSAKK